MFDDFNPDSTVRILPTLSVIDAVGAETPINNDIIIIETGGGVALVVDPETDEIKITTENAEDSLYYAQKFDTLVAMVEGGDVTGPYLDIDTNTIPAGPAWNFTDLSIYIARLGNRTPEPETGVVFMANDACNNLNYYGSVIPQIGSSSGSGSSNGSSSSAGASSEGSSSGSSSSLTPGTSKNSLALTNICGPCIDCPTYTTLETYVLRIDESIEYLWKLTGDKNTNTIPVSPDGFPLEGFTGVYVQTLALLSFWNYLVHKQSVKSAGQAYGQSVSGTIYYKNISTTAQIDVEMTLTFIFAVKDLNTDVITSWNGINAGNTEIRVLEREGAVVADVQSKTLTANGAIIVFEKASVAPGETIYGDVALLLTDAGLFDNVQEQVMVLVRAEYTNIHLDASYTDIEDKIVYFRPPDEPDASGSGSV